MMSDNRFKVGDVVRKTKGQWQGMVGEIKVIYEQSDECSVVFVGNNWLVCHVLDLELFKPKEQPKCLVMKKYEIIIKGKSGKRFMFYFMTDSKDCVDEWEREGFEYAEVVDEEFVNFGEVS